MKKEWAARTFFHSDRIGQYRSRFTIHLGRNMKIGARFFILYLILINVTAFLLMGIDKRRAVGHKWRIPEKTLFLSAWMLGSIGANLGMQVFRHKTKHKSFVFGMPLILIIQTAAALSLFFYFQ